MTDMETPGALICPSMIICGGIISNSRSFLIPDMVTPVADFDSQSPKRIAMIVAAFKA